MANTLTLGTSAIRELDGLYSLNDLHQASGGNSNQRPGEFLRIEQTKALIAEIETADIPAVKTREGRNGGTYACRELVIAYAAWISAAFHLKVIRVFLSNQTPAPAAAPPHPNSIDPRALLLGGQTALLAPLPDDVATAIDAKAWDMAREAHTLARQHLLRRVAYSAQVGTAAPRLNTKAAKAAVASTTLGNALAHLYATEVRRSVQAMQAIAQVHQTQLAQAMADLAAMGMGEPQ